MRPNGRSIDNGRKQHVSSPDEFVNPLAALKPLTRVVRLDDVVLKPRWRRELEQFTREWRCREVLRKEGLSARTKLFFHGPPGCGKSLTAMALGHELSLPVYVVRFDAVSQPYETAAVPQDVEVLCSRTLGRGTGKADRLANPGASTAVLLWQGVLEGPTNQIQVQIPVPRDWWRRSKNPRLRLIVAYDPQSTREYMIPGLAAELTPDCVRAPMLTPCVA